MADQTIVNYELVEKYSKEFENQAEILAESISALKNKAQGLESFWIGKAADKFFDEFFQDVMPATGRLHAALLAGAETLRKIINLYETSDQECADYFSESALDSSVAGADVGGGGGGGGGSASPQSQGMEGNLRMGVAASGQGTASPSAGEGSDSGAMADHVYDSGSSSAGPTTAATSQPAGGGEAQPGDSNNIPKAAGGIAGAAAAGAAAKRKKDSKDEQD